MAIEKEMIDKLKDQIEEEYKKKLGELNQDRKDKLKAIKLLSTLGQPDLKKAEPDGVEPDKKRGRPRTKKNRPSVRRKRNPSVSEYIRETIENTDTDFDKNTIEKKLKENHPDIFLTKDSVRVVCTNMEKDGNLVKIVQGKGKKPTIYRKIIQG